MGNGGELQARREAMEIMNWMAHALAGDDAEGFAVDRVASSEDLVQHARQCDLLVTLPAQEGGRASRKGLERMWG